MAWTLLVTVLSACVLAVFVRPTPRHSGLNQFEQSKFIDMVEGTAYKPFVYRALLPTGVRLVRVVTPTAIQHSLADFVDNHDFTRGAFDTLKWETHMAYSYLIACVLMYLSFVVFAYYVMKLVIFVSETLQDNALTRLIISGLALLGLPAFFWYVSYLYDPPQLALFTASLYFLARREMSTFLLFFTLTCINKETAVLLIPIYAVTCNDQHPRRRYLSYLLAMVVIFGIIKLFITLAYRDNPGSFVAFHQFRHNAEWLMEGWSLSDIATFCLVIFLLVYRWKQKPYFLKAGFLCTMIPLFVLAIFLGYIDEWRGYYEAYPLAVGLILDSFQRLKVAIEHRDLSTTNK
ncbi:MAG: hypothetical protein JSW50_04650 [Candidatus Latescibacterota bacterium]|nr:MAG: hypothetical protein JSW50_04650 [Candidatus Latescibacterota bacterium]